MAKRKWYVVTVGKAIGVFDSWIEVGPLVKGVSGALHQSFQTEEEARRVFEQARANGNTKIVGEEGLPEFSRVQVELHPPRGFAVHPAASPLFRANSEPSPLVSRSSTPTTALGSSLSHAPFEVTSDWPVVATHHVRQASATVQPASNSISSAYDHQPRVSVKAPPWQLTYPIAHDFPSVENLALSPLSRADIPLSPLPLGTPKTPPHRFPSVGGQTPDIFSNASRKPPQKSSTTSPRQVVALSTPQRSYTSPSLRTETQGQASPTPPHRSPSVGGQTPDIFSNASRKSAQKLSTTSPRQVVTPSTPQRSYTSPSLRTDTQGQALPNSDRHASQTSRSQSRSRVDPNHEVYAHGFKLELDPRSPVLGITWQPRVPAVNSLSFTRSSSPEVRALSSSMFVPQ